MYILKVQSFNLTNNNSNLKDNFFNNIANLYITKTLHFQFSTFNIVYANKNWQIDAQGWEGRVVCKGAGNGGIF